MKKTVKGLIIAASVAAVVGVSAVSFAAWQAGDAKTQAVAGTTGSINTVGSITVTPGDDMGTLAAMSALYPVDQGAGYLTYWEFTVTTTGQGAQTVKIEGGLTEGTADGKTALGAAKLYWTATQPTSATTAVETNEIGTTAKEITLSEDNKVYVYMVAGDTDAMKATIDLTFSATAAAEA
ncbi:MAG: hypothetical protein K2M47_06255 [Clostridiales bacterium]|nr:hypothetical protein [Clostridiales bacterium]